MKYTELTKEKIKEMSDEDLDKVLKDNSLAVKESEENLKTANGKIDTLERENQDLKKKAGKEEEKSAQDLIKELF